LSSNFFVFRWSGEDRIAASWFIHASAGHPLVVALLDALVRYWTSDIRRRPYFQLHYLLEALVTLYPDLGRSFYEAPNYPAAAAHRLQRLLQQPFDDAMCARILRQSWVHKLRHKGLPRSGYDATFLARILESELT
jgi:hypothetical protein